jgi:hypothetical protein
MLRTYGVTQRRGAATSEWARPSDWLALPEVFAGEQRITALFAVFDHGSNFVAFTISGAYTVDWGDGTVQNFAAGTAAQRNYSYSALGAGTLSTLGYRQAIITITPQAGQNFTSVNFNVKHSQAGLQNNYSAGWLDINMAGALISTLNIQNYLGMLRRFNFPGTNVITSFLNFCGNCTALAVIPALHTASGSQFVSFCFGCASLLALPAINTASGTDFTAFCQGCASLITFPLIDTTNGLNFSSFCRGCTALTTFPLINTIKGTNFFDFCRGCTALTTLPLINTAAGTNFTTMCFGNTSLISLPALNVAAGTAFTSFCGGCVSLSRSQITGTSRTISYANMRLGQAELVEIFNNLATVVGQTITISGNWGAALLTAPERAIALNKGWTISG